MKEELSSTLRYKRLDLIRERVRIGVRVRAMLRVSPPPFLLFRVLALSV